MRIMLCAISAVKQQYLKKLLIATLLGTRASNTSPIGIYYRC